MNGLLGWRVSPVASPREVPKRTRGALSPRSPPLVLVAPPAYHSPRATTGQ